MNWRVLTAGFNLIEFFPQGDDLVRSPTKPFAASRLGATELRHLLPNLVLSANEQHFNGLR